MTTTDWCVEEAAKAVTTAQWNLAQHVHRQSACSVCVRSCCCRAVDSSSAVVDSSSAWTAAAAAADDAAVADAAATDVSSTHNRDEDEKKVRAALDNAAHMSRPQNYDEFTDVPEYRSVGDDASKKNHATIRKICLIRRSSYESGLGVALDDNYVILYDSFD